MGIENFIRDALHKPDDYIAYHVGRELAELYPRKAILEGEKEEIQTDLAQFFAARETYERYRIPWKRGVLFTGPPGNGKTHTVKALINQLNKPSLYVKGFKSEYATDQENIALVFERARMTTPCLLVFEDLDSMLDETSRSVFLNELDGFETNAGIVVREDHSWAR